MIQENEILLDEDFENQKAFWWEEVCEDTNDIAVKSNEILEYGIKTVSVPPKMVPFVWTWLEKSGVKIYTRYDFATTTKKLDADFDELVKNISSVFKQGATGVQIFVKMSMFEKIMDILSVVKNDLFFEHELCICMDINDIDIHNLGMIFEKLNAVHANAFGITLDHDDGKRSDFIGRIYSLLDNWTFDGNLHCILIDSKKRIDQIMRLTDSVRPDLYPNLRFFLG